MHPALEEPGAALSEMNWRPFAGEVQRETVGESVVRMTYASPGSTWVGARFERSSDERFWGFGIRSDAAERIDGVVENWVGEGPYQEDEYELVATITPRWALRRRRDAAYYPVPWLMSSAGYGVLIDNDEYSRFRLGRPWSVEVRAESLSLRVFAGASLAELLRGFTRATGVQPLPARSWFLGPWISTGHADLVPLETEREILGALREANAAVSAVETHMRRLPGGAHERRRDTERSRTQLFHAHGLASLTYLNPFVSEDYARRFDEALPLLQKHEDGAPYLYTAYIGGREPPLTVEGQLDFTQPAAEEFFAARAREAIEDGHDGWMEDFGEYTPPDSIARHNAYPLDFHGAGARVAKGAARPIARFVRSGWTGVAPHAPLVWGGDPTTGWGFDGLASALTQGLAAGLSGVAFWGTDIGGFFTLGEQRLDAELLIRWIQLGAFSPLMRTKAEGVAILPYRRPQVWDPEILPHWRRWAGFHTQLSPYLMAAAAEYVDTGMPVMRHMRLVDPSCERQDQYMLGGDLLVAPVLEAGATSRDVELPAGRWVELWGREVFEGPATLKLAAPLEEIPVLARAGARIPLLPADILSLAAPHDAARRAWLDFTGA